MTNNKEGNDKVSTTNKAPTRDASKLTGFVNCKLKTRQEQALQYKGLENIASLIKFVGKPPALLSDLSLKYKKHIIKAGMYVFCDTLGNVTKVMSSSEFNALYEITYDK